MADTLDLLSSEGLDTAQPVAGLDLLPQEPTGFSRGFGAGASGVKSSLYGAGALASRVVGATGLEQAALAKSAEHANAAAAQSIDAESVDWTSPRAVASYFSYLLGSAVPSLATMAVGGVAGRALGAYAARGATAAVANATVRNATLAGAVVPDVALESGSIFPEAVRTGVEDPALRALAGGAAAASLDFVPLLAAEKYLKAAGKGGFGAMARGAAKGASVGAALEGGQEALQSVIERAAAGQPLTGADAESDYLNSFLGGAAPGVVIGGGIGAHRASTAPVQPTPTPPPEPPAPAGLLPPAQAPVKIVFPDGSVINSQQELDAHLATFPPEQQVRERARLMGMGAQFASPEAQDDAAQATLTAQHSALTEQINGYAEQSAAAQEAHTAATGRIAALNEELSKPVGERRPKEEILVERKAAQEQATALKSAMAALDTQAGEARKQVDTIAPELSAVSQRIAKREALAATPTGRNPAIQPRTEAPDSSVIETKPPAADTTAAETAVAQVKRSLGMLVSSREAKLAPVQTPREVALERAAGNAPRESVKTVDAKTQQGAIETAAVQAAQPAIKELVAAKALSEGGTAKVTRLLTDALNTIAKEAATKPTMQAAQQHIGTEVPKALKGRVKSVDAAEIAATMINAVGQSHTLYSKSAAQETAAPQDTGALTTEQFHALPPDAKNAAVDFYNAVVAQRGIEMRAHLHSMIGRAPGVMVRTFMAHQGEPIGSYTRTGPLQALISLAINAKDGTSVADHEGYHYAEDQLLDSRERAVVREALKPGSPTYKRLVAATQAYDLANRTQLTDEVQSTPEEARAYAFEFWRRGKLQVEGGLARVYEKIRQFLERLANFIAGQGFQSIEDVFTALARGQYAERSRNEGNVLGGLAAEAQASNGALIKRLASQKRVELVGMDGGTAVAERIDGHDKTNLRLADGTVSTHADMEAALRAAAQHALIPAEFFAPSIRAQESNGASFETNNPDGQQVELALRTYMSRAASAALTDMDRRYAAGELEREQVSNAVAGLVDRAGLAPITAKQAFGAVGEQALGSLQRWRLKHLATGNYISRFSKGYANVQKALLALVQRKSTLIADGSMVQLSSWHDSATTQADITTVGDVLLERTDKGLALGSQEMTDLTRDFTAHQRRMLKQATDMIAGRLQQEFAAEQSTMQKLLPEAEYAEWFANRQTQVQKLIEQGYVPERRYGDYTTHIFLDTTNPKTGKPERLTVHYEQFENQAAADVRAQQYQALLAKEAPELKVEAGYRYKVERDASISIQQFLDAARRNGVDLTQAERERLAKALVSADSVRRNRMFRRKNIPGYSQDIMRVLHEFVVTTANKVAYTELSGAINDAIEGKPVDVRTEQGKPVVATDANRSLWREDGPQAGFYRNLSDELVDYVLVPDHSGNWSRKLRGAAMVYFIGGSLAAGAVNTMSIPMNTVPWLSMSTGYTNAFSKTFASMKLVLSNISALRDLPTLKDRSIAIKDIDAIPGLRDALIVAAEDGRTMDTEIHQIMGMAQGASYAHSRKVQKAMEVWMSPFKMTEQVNRLTTFIAGYRVGVDNKLTGRALYEFAAGAVDNTQNRYDEVNRPGLARNQIGALLFMFKSFPLFMVEMIETMYRQNPKAAVYMLLGLTMMTGVQGLPFAETIEDLIDTIAQRIFGSPFNTRRAMRNLIKDASEAIVGADLSELVLRGVINEVTGLSMASRIGLGDFVPGTRIGAADNDYGRTAEQILGAPFSMVTGVASSAGKLLKGDFLGAMRAGGPVAVRNLIKGAEQLDRGYGEDASGRKLVDVTGPEAFWQMAGFSSAALNKAYELDKIDQQSKAFYTEVRKDFTQQLVQAVKDNDATAAQETYAAMAAWNAEYPDMPIALNPSAIRRQVALAGLPLNERTMRTLPRLLRGSSIAAEGY